MNIIAFTVADAVNLPLAEKMIKSFHKFHPDIEVKIYNDIAVGSKENYYRATPMFAKELLGEYDLVLKLDADQIITGELTHVFEAEYDIGVVINYSRADVAKYGLISCWDIPPDQYFNCGFVAMKNLKFVEHWWALCNSYHFNNYRFKEQDFLNIMIHYGWDYKVECFDKPTPEYKAWHGLLSKGEWHRAEMRDGKLILPKGEDHYPSHDTELKVLHWAGGGNEEKMNYKIYFNEEVIVYLDSLVS